MKKIAIIIIGLLLIVLIVMLTKSFSVSINSKNISTSSNLKAKENNEGLVAITVTPLNLTNNSEAWDFEITLDTHSGALDADMVAVSELVDDQGKIYKPISWEGDGPDGHHRKGILKFNSILPKPKSIELKIKNVGDIPERSFKWIF